MKRLIKGMGLNNIEEYNSIFFERKEKGIDLFDLKRWKRLLRYYKGGKLIDLGCLDSLVTKFAKDRFPGSEIWGIDTADKAIQEMKKENKNIYFQVGDVYNTEFPTNYFDYAVAGELIEHLDDPKSFFKETFRILKKGGILALSTPFEEEKEIGAKDLNRHIWSFSKEDLIELSEPYGSIRIKIMGSQYFPIYKYNWPNLICFIIKR